MDFQQLYNQFIGQQHKAVLAAILLYLSTSISPGVITDTLAQAGLLLPVEVVTAVLALLGAFAVWLVPNVKPVK